MRNQQQIALIVGLLLITLTRLVIAAAIPLLDDEAYYWTWSRRLSWGYPDHPPMIAALIRLTTGLAGNTPAGVRLGPVLLTLGTSVLLFDLGRKMFGPAAGIIAAFGYQLIPAFSVGAAFAFPDAPFAFFWMLTLWFFWRARGSGRMSDWYAAGLSLGCAMISKLPAAVLAASLAAFLVASPEDRRWFGRPEPFRAIAISLAVFFPVISWNADNHWLTFIKTREPIPWIRLDLPLLNALAFAAAQLVYYGPLTCVLLLLALRECLRAERRVDPRCAFLAWTALPIIALTWAASFDGLSKPHWPAPGYLVALIPAAGLWLGVRSLSRWRRIVGAAATTSLVVIAAFYLLPFWPTSSVAGEVWGWDQVAAKLASVVERTPPVPGVFILTNRYQTASQLEFSLHSRYLVTTPYEGDAFAVRTNPQKLIDWNGVFINDLASGPGLPLHRIFRKIEQVPQIEVTINGRLVRRFSVYRGYGFRGFPRPAVHPI